MFGEGKTKTKTITKIKIKTITITIKQLWIFNLFRWAKNIYTPPTITTSSLLSSLRFSSSPPKRSVQREIFHSFFFSFVLRSTSLLAIFKWWCWWRWWGRKTNNYCVLCVCVYVHKNFSCTVVSKSIKGEHCVLFDEFSVFF